MAARSPSLVTTYDDREPPLNSRSTWIAEEGLDPSRNEARASERGMAARSPSFMTTYKDREPPLDSRSTWIAEEGLEPPTRGL